MLKELWDSLTGPAKFMVGVSVAETLANILLGENDTNTPTKQKNNDPRKERLRNSDLYRDPMTAFYNLTPENQQKVLEWGKRYNLSIEEVIRKVIDR